MMTFITTAAIVWSYKHVWELTDLTYSDGLHSSVQQQDSEQKAKTSQLQQEEENWNQRRSFGLCSAESGYNIFQNILLFAVGSVCCVRIQTGVMKWIIGVDCPDQVK